MLSSYRSCEEALEIGLPISVYAPSTNTDISLRRLEGLSVAKPSLACLQAPHKIVHSSGQLRETIFARCPDAGFTGQSRLREQGQEGCGSCCIPWDSKEEFFS